MNPYVHDLVIRRSTFDDSVGARDEYGQPARVVSTLELRGLVQPKSGRELENTIGAGTDVGDHVIFLPLMDLATADRIEHDGQTYHITHVRQFDFGRLPHLEVDARLVTTASTIVEGS